MEAWTVKSSNTGYQCSARTTRVVTRNPYGQLTTLSRECVCPSQAVSTAGEVEGGKAGHHQSQCLARQRGDRDCLQMYDRPDFCERIQNLIKGVSQTELYIPATLQCQGRRDHHLRVGMLQMLQLLLLLLSLLSDSSRPHGLQPTRLLRPWVPPGKSTGVGCHYLLRKMILPSDFFFFFLASL